MRRDGPESAKTSAVPRPFERSTSIMLPTGLTVTKWVDGWRILHQDLTVPAEPTDPATIGRQMRAAGRPTATGPGPRGEHTESVRPADAEAVT
jgi:hypothetical protein